jgi:GxxExxY protein
LRTEKVFEPQMHTDEHRLNEISEKVIGCAYVVQNTLGCGFLEKVYENSVAIELRKAGFSVEQQKGIIVRYGDQIVGEYFADLLVNGCLVVELKTVKALDNVHVAQGLNYLKATGLQLCLLINFGKPSVEVRRLKNGY